jgi:hypothetical protein
MCAVVIGLTLFFHGKPSGTSAIPQNASGPTTMRPPARTSPRVARPAGPVTVKRAALSALPADRQAPGPEPVIPASAGPELAQIPLDNKPLARVNGVDLTPSKIFSPGVMRSGDKLPKVALDKFLEDAVNRAVVVQEAEKRGFAEAPDFIKLVDDLRGDVAELPDLTPEAREWQLNELRDMALMNRVFQEEGIVPRRLGPDEVEAYYQAHAAEYDWVRKRETLKGSTPEKIERRIREEIRKDIQIPIKQELSQKRDAFTAALRETANVELLSDSGAGVPK